MTNSQHSVVVVPAENETFVQSEHNEEMRAKVEEFNEKLKDKSTAEILEFFKDFDGLYQMTSFGLTGLVTLHLLKGKVPLIFINTLYLFDETIELVTQISNHFSVTIHEFRIANDKQEFESRFGAKLYKTDQDKYDYLVKALPAHYAYAKLKAKFVLTGRRRSQGHSRKELPICEWDASNQIVKINPLYNWDYDQVWDYIKKHNVPYNRLHDLGYKSIGDIHSTEKTKPDEGERDGRWKGQEKTECGLHEDYFAKKLAAKAQ